MLFQDERLRATSAGSLSPETAGAIATGAGVSVSCSEAVRMGLAGSDWEKKDSPPGELGDWISSDTIAIHGVVDLLNFSLLSTNHIYCLLIIKILISSIAKFDSV